MICDLHSSSIVSYDSLFCRWCRKKQVKSIPEYVKIEKVQVVCMIGKHFIQGLAFEARNNIKVKRGGSKNLKKRVPAVILWSWRGS